MRFIWQCQGFIFGDGGKQGENRLKVVAFLQGGLGRVFARYLACMQAVSAQEWRKVSVEIVGSVSKSCKNKHFFIISVERIRNLLLNELLKMLQLGVIFRRDLVHGSQQGLDNGKVCG